MENYKGVEFFCGSSQTTSLCKELLTKLGIGPKQKQWKDKVKMISQYMEEAYSDGWSEGARDKEAEMNEY